MSFLERVAACNRHDLGGFRRFRIEGAQIGWVRPALIARLVEMTGIFQADDNGVRLAPELGGFADRTCVSSTA